MEARMISSHHEFSIMHNKGMVIDDISVVSSINWGDSALHQNREVGVAVRSAPITSFFAELFWQDWSEDPVVPKAVLPWTYLTIVGGEPVLLDASSSIDNTDSMSFSWDIDADGIEDSNTSTFSIKLSPGNHTIVLTVRDGANNSANATCWVNVVPIAEGRFDAVPMAAAPVLVAFIVMAWKRIIRKKHNG
jgi:hypothetical protein